MTESPTDTPSATTTLLDQSPYEQKLLGLFDRRVLSTSYARWILGMLVAGILLVPSIQFLHKIQQTEETPYREGGVKHRTAVGRWLPDAQALVDGEDPYGIGHWFPNPPLVLMTLVPFAYLPLPATAVLWSILKIAAMVAACWLLVKSYRGSEVGVPLGVMIAAMIFSVRPIMGDITHGNINIFVFFEIALVWYLFVNHRDMLAGVVIGLAIVTKVTPGLLLVYFLYKRAWRVVAGAGIGLILFALVIPTLIVGFDRNIALLSGWFSMMIDPFVFQGYVTTKLDNQSLSGLLVRCLDLCGFIEVQQITLDQAKLFGVEMGAMGRPVSFLGKAVLRAASLAVIAALAWLCRSPLKNRRDPRLFLELSLILIAMLLLSERTWKHHLTTLPMIYLSTWLVLACYPWSKHFTVLFVTGLVIQFLLLVVFKGDKMLYIGVITMALVLCFIQNAILLRRLNARSLQVQQ